MKHGSKTTNFLNRFTTIRLYYVRQYNDVYGYVDGEVMVYKARLIHTEKQMIRIELARNQTVWKVLPTSKDDLLRDWKIPMEKGGGKQDFDRMDPQVIELLLKPHNCRNIDTQTELISFLNLRAFKIDTLLK